MEDELNKIIATIKETLQEQTDLIKEQRFTIIKQENLINSLCDNYQKFIDGILELPLLPESIRKQVVETQILLEQIKS